MKVLYFTKYNNLGASSRLRSIQFIPYLTMKGYDITLSPLFNDSYLKALYRYNKIKYFFIITGYVKRLFSLYKVFTHDIVVIEKELFPYLPAIFEVILKKIGIKFYSDYDDAIFHNYDLSNNRIIRRMLSKKIDTVMKNSYTVFAGNSYLAERAYRAKSKNVIILPTVIDAKKYFRISENNSSNKFVIGWIGSPSTYKYIENLIPIFHQLKIKYSNIEIRIIGAKQNEQSDSFIHYIPWSEELEVYEINKFNVGLMPLNNTPWELGKCSYKLIQYMGCSVAVLGSPVGMNNDVIVENYNGKFVQNNDWYRALEFYILNKDLAETHGNNGKLLIDSKYNINNNIKLITKAFEN